MYKSDKCPLDIMMFMKPNGLELGFDLDIEKSAKVSKK